MSGVIPNRKPLCFDGCLLLDRAGDRRDAGVLGPAGVAFLGVRMLVFADFSSGEAAVVC